MNITIGENYINRTWKYLLPCLNIYGPQFRQKLVNVFKLAVGIGDTLYTKNRDKSCLFLLIDKKINNTQFKHFIEYVYNQVYYVDDYCFDDPLTGRLHIVVIEMPSIYKKSYERFLEGNYSKMYTKENIANLYDKYNSKSKVFKDVRHVLTRDRKAIPSFIKVLKNTFGDDINLTVEDAENHKEYDLPLNTKEEIFNYNEEWEKNLK